MMSTGGYQHRWGAGTRLVWTGRGVWTSAAAANQRFMAAFSRGDAAGLAAFYSSDARLLPPGSPPISGAAGIQAFWRGAIDTGITAVRLETEELELHGGRAIEGGCYSWKPRRGRSTGASTW